MWQESNMIEISQSEVVAAYLAALSIEIGKLVVIEVESKKKKRKKI